MRMVPSAAVQGCRAALARVTDLASANRSSTPASSAASGPFRHHRRPVVGRSRRSARRRESSSASHGACAGRLHSGKAPRQKRRPDSRDVAQCVDRAPLRASGGAAASQATSAAIPAGRQTRSAASNSDAPSQKPSVQSDPARSHDESVDRNRRAHRRPRVDTAHPADATSTPRGRQRGPRRCRRAPRGPRAPTACAERDPERPPVAHQVAHGLAGQRHRARRRAARRAGEAPRSRTAARTAARTPATRRRRRRRRSPRRARDRAPAAATAPDALAHSSAVATSSGCCSMNAVL